jgi:hypothetical protein
MNYKDSVASGHDMSNLHFFSTVHKLLRTLKEGGDRLTSGGCHFHLLSQIVAGQSEMSNNPPLSRGPFGSYFITELPST